MWYSKLQQWLPKTNILGVFVGDVFSLFWFGGCFSLHFDSLFVDM